MAKIRSWYKQDLQYPNTFASTQHSGNDGQRDPSGYITEAITIIWWGLSITKPCYNEPV